MKTVLAYCYGYHFEVDDDMDLVLEIYKLADKYILDGLRSHCCKLIVNNMTKDNVKVVMEFVEKFIFSDFMNHNCVPYFKELFHNIDKRYKESTYYEDEPDYTVSSTILMNLKDDWLGVLMSEVCGSTVFNFECSWKNPECPLKGNRISTILSN